MGLALDANGNVYFARSLHFRAGTIPSHPSALSVIAAASFSWTMLQATIAILLLVGFESVTSLGEEANNPKRDIPRAVLLRSRFRACSVT